MSSLRLLTTLGSEFEAEIIRQKLAEAGIQSLIKSGDMDSMLPPLDYTGGVGVYVEPDDFDEALSLIGGTEDDLTDDMEVGVGD